MVLKYCILDSTDKLSRFVENERTKRGWRWLLYVGVENGEFQELSGGGLRLVVLVLRRQNGGLLLALFQKHSLHMILDRIVI